MPERKSDGEILSVFFSQFYPLPLVRLSFVLWSDSLFFFCQICPFHWTNLQFVLGQLGAGRIRSISCFLWLIFLMWKSHWNLTQILIKMWFLINLFIFWLSKIFHCLKLSTILGFLFLRSYFLFAFIYFLKSYFLFILLSRQKSL